MSEEKFPIRCFKCGETFKTKADLEKHWVKHVDGLYEKKDE